MSEGANVVEFAAAAGLFLDPWQQDVLIGAMGLRSSGAWAARHVGLLVPRQNGKGSILEARELYGMFASDERLIIHSAHKYDTSQKHFARVLALIESNPDLERHIRRLSRVAGKESVELKDGSLLQFKARTLSGTARGFTGDCLVLDEAMYLPEEAVDAMLPTASAVPNPQTWVTSSAGMQGSGFLWRVVQRGRAGHPSMAYFEWGTPLDADVADRRVWAAANPALGQPRPHSVQMEALEDDFGLMTPEGFAREHLGVWDGPADGLIDPVLWAKLADPDSSAAGDAIYAVDVSLDLKWAALGMAGRRADGLMHVSVDNRPALTGLAWVVPRCRQLSEQFGARFLLDRGGPAWSLAQDLEDAGVTVIEMSLPDVRQACGMFLDAVAEGRLRHRGQPDLDAAVLVARPRPVGEGGPVFGRKSGEITSLNAAAFAHWWAVSNSYDVLSSVF